MKSTMAWQLFLDTGSPEMYLLYNALRKAESSNVPDASGVGFTDNCIQ